MERTLSSELLDNAIEQNSHEPGSCTDLLFRCSNPTHKFVARTACQIIQAQQQQKPRSSGPVDTHGHAQAESDFVPEVTVELGILRQVSQDADGFS